MDPANGREAVRESVLDVSEGADMLMVKPAMSYLDIAYRIKEATGLPLAGYYVSGEYSMLRAAAERGWIDERQATLEALTCMQRAGIDVLITYAAIDAARWLREENAAHTAQPLART
jgi:porphobilinogen synthase